MLAEWYFCCCIDASPSNTNTFLHIWEIIHDPESDWRTLSLALEELQKTDVWMQLYLLEEVLATLHRENLPKSTQAIIESYCKDLLEFMPKKTGKLFRSLIDSAYFFTADPANQLQICAEAISGISNRSVSSTPYLDLKEFIAETVLLCVIEDLIKNDPESSSKIAVTIKNSREMELLLNNALQHEYGRLACRSAAMILSSVYPREYLLQQIWQNRYCTAELEPDLMQTSVRLLFSDTSTTTSELQGSNPISLIINESVMLDKLYGLSSYTSEENSDWSSVLNRIGYDSTEIAQQGLSIIYWQTTLWQLAAEMAVEMDENEQVVGLIAKYWDAPQEMPRQTRHRVHVYAPLAVKELPRLTSDLETLLDLRGLRKEIIADAAKEIKIPRHSRWAFFSPWLRLNPSFKPNPEDELRYIELNAVSLIRLFVCAFISVKVLRKLNDNHRHKAAFASLVAHASSVLSLYSNWLWNYASPEKRAKDTGLSLKPSITGLALFARGQIEFAGRGNIETISPSIFLKILRDHQAQDFQRESDSLSLDEKEFYRSVLSEVLISWITGAYTGASESSGAARWLTLIPDVYDFYKRGNHSKRSEREAAVVVRFLCPAIRLDRRRFDNWEKSYNWRMPHRLLLLTDRLPATNWIKPPRWKEPTQTSEGFATKLARSIERVAALANDSSAEHRDAWRNEWVDCMNSITEKKELDRFTRLRLIELLDSAELRDWPEGQELIALILLEYGVYYELKKMFDVIYFEHDPSELTEIRRELQEHLAKAIYKDIEISSRAQENRVNAGHPRDVQNELKRIEFIKSILARLAYFNRVDAAKRRAGSLGNLLRDLETQSLEQQLKRINKEVKGYVEQHEGKNVIMLPPETPVHPWMIQGMAYDPNTLNVTISIADLDTREVANFFELEGDQYRDFYNNSNNEIKWVLAVVVNIEKEGQNDERCSYTFNCGLHYYLTEEWEGKPVFDVGQYVMLPVYKMDRKDRWRIPKSQRSRIRTLRYKLSPGDIVKADIDEGPPKQSSSRSINISYENRAYKNPALDIWDANLAAAFSQSNQQNKSTTYARIGNKGQLTPLDLGLTNLLLEGLSYSDFSVAVLTLVHHADYAELPEKSWRFSTRPGHNYLLRSSDFLDADAAEIERKINSLDDPKGLLLTVEPVIDNENVRLRLVKEKKEDQGMDSLYPDLTVPFDYRNLAWRDVFKEGESYIATNEWPNWVVKVDPVIPGFSEKIPMHDWEVGSPPRRYSKVEFTVGSWIPRDAELTGTYVEIQSLSIPKDKYKQFLSQWLHITKGDRIQLAKAVGKVSGSGTVMCLTKERMAVFAEVESLTMEALPMNLSSNKTVEVIGPDKYRDAEVIGNPWWKSVPGYNKENQSLEIEDHDIQQVVRQGRCRGIFIEVPAEAGNTLYQVLWEVEEQAVPLSLTMELPTDLRIKPGTRITGELNGERWSWSLDTLNLYCLGLWSVREDWQPDGSKVHYLGTVLYRNQYRPVAQIEPGELVILRNEPESVAHLAVGDGVRFKEKLRWGVEVVNKSSNHSAWKDGGMWVNRAVLEFHNNIEMLVLTGICRDDRLQYRQLSLNDVTMYLYSNGDRYHFLKRTFRVSGVKDSRPKSKPPVVEKGPSYWKKRLTEYLELPAHHPERRLVATMQGETVAIADVEDLSVPQDAYWSLWSKKAMVPDSEVPYMNPRHANYRPNARVALFKNDTDNRVYASYRRVPPLTTDAFMTDVHGKLDHFTQLANGLFYIGEESRDPLTGEEYEEPHHRFEWGAGKMLVAPESRLRFDGGAFSTSRMLLNVGDMITGVTFHLYVGAGDKQHEELREEEDRPRGPRCIIEINTYKLNTRERLIHQSQATHLYNQRRDYQIVHILHLHVYPDDSRVKIEYVEAFNDNGIEPFKPYNEARASLTEKSKETILSRSRNKQVGASDEPMKVIVFGRLNEQAFRETRGSSVLFELVRLSFEESDEGSCLRDGERIFLKAGEINDKLKNDMALTLTWHGVDRKDRVIDQEYVGWDFQKPVLMLRRYFSERENRLQRICDLYGQDYLKNDKLLVRVEKGYEKVYCSLTKTPPLRTPQALRTMIGQKKFFLAVVSEAGKESVIIELKASVYTQLEKERIESRPDELERGAIVQIENCPSGKFRIKLAAYGDLRYVPDGSRPGLVLPKNPLFKKDKWKDPVIFQDRYWSEQENFSVGGLPNLTPQPGVPDWVTGRWRRARARDCIELMEMPHPKKIVLLGRDRDNAGKVKVRFAPAPKSLPVGSLQVREGELGVDYVPLGKDEEVSAHVNLRWHQLSFADRPAMEIINRINNEQWKYHDEVTAYVIDQNGELIPHEDATGKHDCWRGPLFFENTGKTPKLRYTRKNFLKFGFPVEQLILSLLSKEGRRATYHVAGVPEEGGLWIEIAPGRIVELPPHLVVGQARSEEFQLNMLNWEAFAPGDEVELEATSTNPLQADRILIRDWKPGPRGAFGSNCCLLPVAGHDLENGALKLGSGGFMLSFPMSVPNTSWKVVVLYPDNRIHDGRDFVPGEGDVVLLGLNESGEPTVLGFNDLTPVPDRKKESLWQGDPFAEDVLRDRRG